jgi:tetratricopeptide (TPR) repeat protein
MTRITQIRLLLLLAIVLVFGRIVTHDFVDWDDGPLIYNNPNVTGHTMAGLLRHWNPANVRDNSSMYNPVVFTLWWALAHGAHVENPDLLGATLNPDLFHAASLAVHWLCACAVVEILRRLRIGDWAAAAGGLVFALHPLQTEAVAWATAMKDLLSGFFALLSIWRYLAALESPKPRRRTNYWLATMFFAAALLSKPSTVVVPAIVAVIDRMIYRRSWRDVAKWLWPWFAMAIVITVIAANVQELVPGVGGPMWARPLIALDALAFYLGKLVLPIDLRFDYGRSPAAALTDPALHHPLYWTWIFPAALAAILWRTKRRMLSVAGLIFLLGLLPVLGLKTFAYQYYTTVADRYVYLPMLGVALAIGWWIDQHKGRLVKIATCAVIVVLGSLSFVQAGRWTDTETLYSYSLNGTRSIHYIILGEYQDDLAKPCFLRAIQAARRGQVSQARDFAEQGDAYVEKAMEDYKTATRLEPTDTHGYDRLANDLVQLGRVPEAIQVVKQWMNVEPQAPSYKREKPGALEYMLGKLYLQNHQFPEAVDMLKRSLALAPKPDPDVAKTLEKAQKLAQTATRPVK